MDTQVSKNIAPSPILAAVAWVVTQCMKRPLGLPEICHPNSEHSLQVSRHLVIMKTVIVLHEASKKETTLEISLCSFSSHSNFVSNKVLTPLQSNQGKRTPEDCINEMTI